MKTVHTSVYPVQPFNTLKTIEALICAAYLVLVQEGLLMRGELLSFPVFTCRNRLNNLLKVCIVKQRRARI